MTCLGPMRTADELYLRSAAGARAERADAETDELQPPNELQSANGQPPHGRNRRLRLQPRGEGLQPGCSLVAAWLQPGQWPSGHHSPPPTLTARLRWAPSLGPRCESALVRRTSSLAVPVHYIVRYIVHYMVHYTVHYMVHYTGARRAWRCRCRSPKE